MRERLTAGDTDAQVRAYLVDRYGEFVLFRPPMSWRNAPLWLAGPGLLLVGGGLAFAFIRRRGKASAPPPPLSEAERARLAALIREERALAAAAIVATPRGKRRWRWKRSARPGSR